MKLFKVIMLSLGVILAIILIAGFLFLNSIKKGALPDYNASIDIENLKEEVTVYRDAHAIPHIYAKNEADLYRVVGYVMAQDRLWQMDLLRRVTSGRLSEVLDPGLIGADQLFRSLQFAEKSKKVLAEASPEMNEAIEAYCDGVNQFIKSAKKLPFEFTLLGYKHDPWTKIDLANMIGYMAWDLSMAWDTEVTLYKVSKLVNEEKFRTILPDLAYQETAIFPDFMKNNELETTSAMSEVNQLIENLGLRVMEASNNWAVSGDKSTTGYPLLANDMHLGLNAPGVWYQMHQVVDGKLNVTGVVLPGQPFVICGHNDNIAWGMTNVMLDDIDFYMETIHPLHNDRYLLNGKWHDLRLVEEKISIKGKGDTTVYNRFTHRGPVVSGFKGVNDKVISMNWVGFNMSNELRSVYLFNRAKNWDDFRDAAKTFTSIAQNIVFADKNGDIGLQTSAGIPIREGNGILIYPGDTTQFDWKGYVPFEELPFSYNPENGMVSSANNKTVDDDYPYYISRWFDLPNRIDRIREMLTSKEKLSIADFEDMQSDCNSVFARKYVPVLLDALSGLEFTDTEQEAFDLLEEWDYKMDKESKASLIFEQLVKELMYAVFHDELGDDVYKAFLKQDLLPTYHLDKVRITKTSPWLDDITTSDKVETYSDAVQKAFKKCVATLVELAGKNVEGWKWGDYHTLTLKHPMGGNNIVAKVFKANRGPYRVKGSYHTVGPYSYPMLDGFNANHGASHRHVYSIEDWDQSKTIIPTGTSGIPASEFYCDQTNKYINNEYHGDWFSFEKVKENAIFTSIFK